MHNYTPGDRITERIENAFTFHPVKDQDQAERYAVLRAQGKVFADFIAKNTPECAEQTLAIRALQQAVMWANAAIAIHEAEKPHDEDRLPN